MAVVITDRLTVGQITFILRVLVQITTYGAAFLVGLIVLAYTPTVAVKETHDVINRRVGQSTATLASLQWMKTQIFRSKKNNDYTSPFLVIAILLSLSYTLSSTLSDIGFIGLEACTVPGATVLDFPASVRSLEDARKLMESRMLNGTTPDEVNSYRCEATEDAFLPSVNTTVRMCTAWRNSTYNDPSGFRQLNLTDTDTLMPHFLTRRSSSTQDIVDLNIYFIGSMGAPFPKATVGNGLAIIPHDTGVTTILGVPDLPPFSRVTIPETMAAESNVGCLPVGIFGNEQVTLFDSAMYEYFTLDSAYLAERDAEYVGPKILLPILSNYTNRIRESVLPMFNAANQIGDVIQSFNSTRLSGKWQTMATSWYLPDPPNSSWSSGAHDTYSLLTQCTNDVHNAVHASIPLGLGTSRACALYRISGSQIVEDAIIQVYTNYICASTTQINMVSATIAVDGEGNVTYNTTNLPSDIYETAASYYDITTTVERGPVIQNFDPIVRYTLSGNPTGDTEHFVYQEGSVGVTASFMTKGAGSVGRVFKQAGSAMMEFSSFDEDTLTIINATYFSARPSTTLMTRWVGSIGASFLLGSLTLNPWSALDKPAFEVQSTGGKAATCYKSQYAAGFAPLLLSTFLIFGWALMTVFNGRIKGVMKKEGMYGGLEPAIFAPHPVKPGKGDILAWQQEPEPHLTPVSPFAPAMGGKSEYLLGQFSPRTSVLTPQSGTK